MSNKEERKWIVEGVCYLTTTVIDRKELSDKMEQLLEKFSV